VSEFFQVPRHQNQSSFFGVPNSLITISGQGLLGTHGWLPFDRSGTTDFSFEMDPTLNVMANIPGVNYMHFSQNFR
jgi:hypothetical protein